MNSVRLARELNPLIFQILANHNIEVVRDVSASFAETMAYVPLILDASNRVSQDAIEMAAKIAQIFTIMRKNISNSLLLHDVDDAVKSLTLVFDKNFGAENYYSKRASSIKNDVDNAANQLVGGASAGSVYNFLSSLARFSSFIEEVSRLSDNSSNNESNEERPDFLYFYMGFDRAAENLLEVGEKISSISRLYDEIYIAVYGEKGAGLSVAKLETGSLWVKALGKEVVINIMASILMNCASYVYNKYIYTQEVDEIVSLEIEKFKRIANISNLLEASGSTLSRDSDREKAFYYQVKKAVDKTIYGEPSLMINDVTSAIRPDMRNAFLMSTKIKEIGTVEDQSLSKDELTD